VFNTAFNTEIQALEVLGDASAGIMKREEAIRFLGRHPSQPSIRALIDSMEDDDFGVRWEAATILAQYGELSIPPLLDILTNPNRVSCPRLRDGAYQVLENNASTLIVALSADLRKALKGPAADIATMIAAFRLQQRLKRLQRTLDWSEANRKVSWRT
jgi:HEAT repeat protein